MNQHIFFSNDKLLKRNTLFNCFRQSSKHQCTLVVSRDFWEFFMVWDFGILDSDTPTGL